MKQHEIFLQKAVQLAIDNVKSGNGGPFGAVIVRNDKIIAEGVNLVTSNNDPTAHAEIRAIREACSKLETFKLTDCIIYSSCEPCPMCLGAIYWAGIQRIYFAASRFDAAKVNFSDSFIYDELQKSIEKRNIPTYQVKIKESMKEFEEWKKYEGKIEY